jgi:hypothetical protein
MYSLYSLDVSAGGEPEHSNAKQCAKHIGSLGFVLQSTCDGTSGFDGEHEGSSGVLAQFTFSVGLTGKTGLTECGGGFTPMSVVGDC